MPIGGVEEPGWQDVWLALRPGDPGWTYNTKVRCDVSRAQALWALACKWDRSAALVWVLRPEGPERTYNTKVGWQHRTIPRPPAQCVQLPGCCEALPTRQRYAAAVCSSTAVLASVDFLILLPAGLLPDEAQVGQEA